MEAAIGFSDKIKEDELKKAVNNSDLIRVQELLAEGVSPCQRYGFCFGLNYLTERALLNGQTIMTKTLMEGRICSPEEINRLLSAAVRTSNIQWCQFLLQILKGSPPTQDLIDLSDASTPSQQAVDEDDILNLLRLAVQYYSPTVFQIYLKQLKIIDPDVVQKWYVLTAQTNNLDSANMIYKITNISPNHRVCQKLLSFSFHRKATLYTFLDLGLEVHSVKIYKKLAKNPEYTLIFATHPRAILRDPLFLGTALGLLKKYSAKSSNYHKTQLVD